MQFSQNLNPSALRYRGHYYPLNKPQIVIGSDPACDISIDDNPSVLPMHAQIIAHAGQIYLQALESNAPIWINGTPVTQHVLRDQDIIHLGNRESKLTFLLHWSPTGVEQTMILPPGGQPITGRHATPQVQESAYSSTQYTGTRQAPFHMPEPPAQTQATNSHAQLDFVTHNQTHAQAQAAPQGQTQGQAFTPQAQAAYAPAFAPQGQIPPTPPQTPALQPQAIAYQQPAPHAAANSIATNTTRYLCAAGHLDEGFQDYVLRHIIHEERRALGETYGVNMFAVVSWCKAGLRRINTRDALLGIIFLIICCTVLFKLLQEIAAIFQQFSQLNQYYSQSGYGGYTPSFQEVLLILSTSGLLPTATLLILLWIALGIENWIKHTFPRSHPGFVSLLLLSVLLSFYMPFGLSFLLTLSLWLIIFVELIVRFYGEPTNRLRKGAFNPQALPVELGPGLEHKLRDSFTTAQRNVIAYSGYKPFAGAGYYEGGWSFVVDTNKGALDPSTPHTRLTPQAIDISNLYAQIEQDVRALNVSDVLEIEGKLYVNGQFLSEHPPFFNASQLRPVSSVDPRLVEQYKEHPTEDIRYYQCLRFNFWRGEMIFTAFVRFIQRGKDLFIEVDYLLLPPMKEEYYWVDRKEITPTPGMIWRLFTLSFDGPIKLWFGVPFRLLRGTIYTAEQQKLARVALNSPAFDYGAATSLRWEASDTSYHLFFQKLDEEMYLKITEMQILESIISFLDAHQIDTTELRERQQTILNNNTYINGQNVAIGAMATGIGGHASNNPSQSSRQTTAAQQGNRPAARPHP